MKKRPVAAPELEPILTTARVLEVIPFTRQWIWRNVQTGAFPPPIQLSRGRRGWRRSVILRWLADRERSPVSSRQYFNHDRSASKTDVTAVTDR